MLKVLLLVPLIALAPVMLMPESAFAAPTHKAKMHKTQKKTAPQHKTTPSSPAQAPSGGSAPMGGGDSE
jgi:hypothetical protein